MKNNNEFLKLHTNYIMANSSISIWISILWSGLSSLCSWKVSISIFRRLVSRLSLSSRSCLARSRRSIIVGWISTILRVNIGTLNVRRSTCSCSLSNDTTIPLYLNRSSWALSYTWLPIICYYWFLLFCYIVVVCHIRVILYKIII